MSEPLTTGALRGSGDTLGLTLVGGVGEPVHSDDVVLSQLTGSFHKV